MSRDNGFPPVSGISHNGALHAGVDELLADVPKAFWTLESAADIAAAGITPVAFDIEALLTKDDGPGLLFGPPGSLKSLFAMHVCRCVATGEPVLGKFRVRRRSQSIFVNLDAGRQPTRRRISMVAPGVTNLFVTSPDGFEMNPLRELFAQNEGSFIVIDCFSDMYKSQRFEDQSETMRTFVRDLRAAYQRHGCNGLVIDHPRRAREGETVGDYYGSVQKEAAMRTMWVATQFPSDDPAVARVKISCKKMSEAERFPAFVAKVTFGANRIDFDFDGRVNDVSGMVDAPRDFELLEAALRGVAGGMSRSSLESRLGWSRDRVLGAVRDSKDVVAMGKARNLRYALMSEIDTLESTAAPDDSPVDSPGGPESSKRIDRSRPAPLGPRSITVDSPGDSRILESTVALDDSPGDSKTAENEPLDSTPIATFWAPCEAVRITTITWQPPDAPGALAAIAEVAYPLESEPHYVIRAVEGLIVPPGESMDCFDRCVNYVLAEKLEHNRWSMPSAYQNRSRLWRVKNPRRCIPICKCTVPGVGPKGACDCLTPLLGGICACERPDNPRSAPAAGPDPRRIVLPGLVDLVYGPRSLSAAGPFQVRRAAEPNTVAGNA